MNNNQYISSLKKALAGLDKNSLNDIVSEIKSHAAESGTLMIDQFGPAEELAKQYLDGEKIVKPISTKIWGVSKVLLQVLGIATIAMVGFLALSAYYFTKDKYNYADENASELSEGEWQTQEWSGDLELNLDQASVVIYWHEKDSIRSKCDGSGPEKQAESKALIRHSHCYIYLPKVATSINAEQSQIVLVRPQVSLMINARQASVQVAENGEKYSYDIDHDRSQITDLISKDGAEHSLKFKTKESKISSYEY